MALNSYYYSYTNTFNVVHKRTLATIHLRLHHLPFFNIGAQQYFLSFYKYVGFCAKYVAYISKHTCTLSTMVYIGISTIFAACCYRKLRVIHSTTPGTWQIAMIADIQSHKHKRIAYRIHSMCNNVYTQ